MWIFVLPILKLFPAQTVNFMVQVGWFFQIILAFPEYINVIITSFLRYRAIQNQQYTINQKQDKL